MFSEEWEKLYLRKKWIKLWYQSFWCFLDLAVIIVILAESSARVFPPRQRESHPRNWKAHSQKVCWVILVVERPRNDAPLRDKEKPPGGNSKLTAASFIHLDLPTKKLEKETTRHKVLLIFFFKMAYFLGLTTFNKTSLCFWLGRKGTC